jgi:hypothetical protein
MGEKAHMTFFVYNATKFVLLQKSVIGVKYKRSTLIKIRAILIKKHIFAKYYENGYDVMDSFTKRQQFFLLFQNPNNYQTCQNPCFVLHLLLSWHQAAVLLFSNVFSLDCISPAFRNLPTNE